MKKYSLSVTAMLLCAVFVLCACGRGTSGSASVSTDASPTPEIRIVSTPQPSAAASAIPVQSATPATVQTPAPTVVPAINPTTAPTVAPSSAPVTIATPVPTVAPTVVPSTIPVATPTPTAVSTPTPTPAPTATPSNYPVVTKSPTDETVLAGGSCYFVAKYQNAIWAEWHFVSPDGRDLDYAQAAKEFPTLQLLYGDQSTMQLKNIPETLNGWKVYCRFSNRDGAVTTDRATLKVTTSTEGAPKVTKSPTGETVEAGGSAYFVAKHEGAVWAVWHFVSPDDQRNLTYTDAASEFPTMQIVNGDLPTMQLKNIPSTLNGWKVYCAFSNNIGTVNTASAVITVTAQAAATPQNAGTNGDYTGTYVESVAKRGVMTVSGGPNVYNVSVSWSSSYSETSTWVFSGSFNANGVLNYNNCTKTTSTYNEAGEASTVTDYTSGTGSIQVGGNGLTWTDNVNHVADGTTFLKQ